MKKISSNTRLIRNILILMTIFSLFLSANIQAEILTKDNIKIDEEANQDPGDVNYYALIIGVEIYGDHDFNEKMIKYADKIDDGAKKMYDLLNMTENFKEENIKMILNENATSEKIKESITTWLDDREDENDVVLIYITGHSWKIPFANRAKGHAFYFSYDVNTSEYSENAITDIEFDTCIDTLESEHIVVIFDTCFSGRMLAVRQQGRTILAAGGRYLFCPVDEDDNLGSGIFTYFLLQAFSGIADINNDGWVTAKEAFTYAKMPVIRFTIWQKFPNFIQIKPYFYISGPQIPYLYDNHLGSVKLIQYNTTM